MSEYKASYDTDAVSDIVARHAHKESGFEATDKLVVGIDWEISETGIKADVTVKLREDSDGDTPDRQA